jgi:hypothetical protein
MAALPEPITPIRTSYMLAWLAVLSIVLAVPAVLLAPVAGCCLAAVAGMLTTVHVLCRRLRRRRFERRYGFLPEPGRDDVPRNGRTTLFRVELGQRGTRVCVMVARWRFAPAGWERAGVVHHAWVDGEDPVALGEARANAQLLAERGEDEAEDGELLAQEAEARVESWLYDAREARRRTRHLLDELTRDPD